MCVCVWTIVGTARQTCCCCCCCWWDSSSSSSCSWCQGCSRFLEGIQQRCRQSCWLSCQPYGCTCVWLCVCLAVCVRLTVLACLFFCPLTIGRTCATFLSSFSFHVCPLSICLYPYLCLCLPPESILSLSLFLYEVCLFYGCVCFNLSQRTWAKMPWNICFQFAGKWKNLIEFRIAKMKIDVSSQRSL